MPNAIPSHALWVELSTRITTQRLHFRSGEEETAVKSIFSLFGKTRKLLEEHPDAKQFCTVALRLLNDVLRPYTARWHGWMTEAKEARNIQGDAVLKFRDEWVRRNFRRELRKLQPRLIGFLKAFEALKDGKKPKPWWTSPNAKQLKLLSVECPPAGKANLGKPLAAGIEKQVHFTGMDPGKQSDLTKRINAAESAEIRRKRGDEIDGPIMNAAGLALSGGGIRSATFCLGITQVLARRKLFQKFDYLSTVSGGGYFGAFLSAYLGTDDPAKPAGGNSPANGSDDADKRIEKTFVPGDDKHEPEPLRHLRNRSRYLVDGGFMNTAKGVGLVLAGVLFNLLIVLPFPVFAAVFTVCFHKNFHLWGNNFGWIEAGSPWFSNIGAPISAMLVAALIVLGTLLLVYPGVKWHALRVRRQRQDSRQLNVWNDVIAIVTALAVGGLMLWLVPAGFRLYHLLRSAEFSPWMTVLQENMESIMGLVGILATAILGAAASKSSAGGRLGPWLKKLAILSGPVLYLFVYFGSGYRMMFASPGQAWSEGWVAFIALLMLVWAWLCVNVNTYSPHGYYRDRLSRCYLIWRKWRSSSGYIPHTSADKLRLTELNVSTAAPYHLINTTVNLPTSNVRDLRGRNGDFFVFSKHFCGSPVCGYHPTKDLESADPHLDLGTAMAISGAAASSNMGWQTSNSLRLVMTLANVRLGYWLRNPGKGMPCCTVGPGPAYLFREMFAKRMDERQNYLNLSDGGHIENLATYELLRRKCKFIVCVDGGMEPDMACVDLMRLERYSAIDLGIKMHYDVSDLMLQSNGYSRAYGILIKIDYDPSNRQGRPAEESPWGWMLYLKLAMIGYGPGYVMDYKRQNPAFPHQTTADQIYDEAQFEAYRALGEAAAESFFRAELIEGRDASKLDGWFQALANSLLPDNDEAFRMNSEKSKKRC